jgi:hypothetical protein
MRSALKQRSAAIETTYSGFEWQTGRTMSFYSDEPELEGYIPHGEKPLHSQRKRTILRVVVILGIVCLVLPGVLTTMSLNQSTAEIACAAWVAYEDSTATGSSAHFELFGPGGIGWQCYTVGAYGGDHNVAPLGLIPSVPRGLPLRSPQLAT